MKNQRKDPNDLVVIELDDGNSWEIPFDEMFPEKNVFKRIASWFRKLFNRKEPPEVFEEDSMDWTAEQDLKVTVADKVMESLSCLEWEHKESEFPAMDRVYVRAVAPAEVDDGSWTLMVEVTPTLTSDPGVWLTLTDFLIGFTPTGSLTFRKYDA